MVGQERTVTSRRQMRTACALELDGEASVTLVALTVTLTVVAAVLPCVPVSICIILRHLLLL